MPHLWRFKDIEPVLLKSAALGPSLFYGQGAGAMPTGSAVVSDVIDLCRNLLAGVSGRLPMLCAPNLQDVTLRLQTEIGKLYAKTPGPDVVDLQ